MKLRSFKKPKKYKSYINYDQPTTCQVDYSILPVPLLNKGCIGQYDLRGKKCFKNKCSKVKGVLSSEDNFLGNVVLIEDPEFPENNVVVKWNRYSEERENMLMELKIQNIAYTLGLAPKILDAYEDGMYFFIIMENLINKGYKTVHDVFMKHILENYWNNGGGLENLIIPENVLKLIGKGLKKLHNLHFIHGDLHPQNVFYNKEQHKIMFIDFGHAKKFKSKKEAKDYEKYSFTYWVTYYGKGSTLPKNWLNIINYT